VKLIVETNGPFQLVIDGLDGFAHHERPSVVRQAHLFSQNAADGKLTVLGQVPDEASDLDFAGKYTDLLESEGDKLKAIAAYIKSFETPEILEEKPLKK